MSGLDHFSRSPNCSATFRSRRRWPAPLADKEIDPMNENQMVQLDLEVVEVERVAPGLSELVEHQPAAPVLRRSRPGPRTSP
jgi:hypothetical protein